jgi:hypothetical protein
MPACRTAEDALAAAIIAAVDVPEDMELYEAMFGQYAATEEGWWWGLRFMHTIGMTSQAGVGDSFAQKTKRIIQAWSTDVAKYRELVDSGA